MNKGLLIFGIILLVIGLAASFYYFDPYGNQSGRTYPYQGIGIALVVTGVVLSALAFLYSPRKTEIQSPPSK